MPLPLAAGAIAAGIAFVRLGSVILRVAKKELPNLLKQYKGAKVIKKPSMSQKKESIVPSQLGKKVDKPKGFTSAPTLQPKTPKQYRERQPPLPKSLDPKKDITFTASGGSVKGRPAKSSAENS